MFKKVSLPDVVTVLALSFASLMMFLAILLIVTHAS